ncbi:C39 family peptidase [Lactobacillus psittaci]|uniref:LytA n=1 Tax=Lactobacillus psittaci DSM 15354 TaxID=1122152 RepID=A0A0R1RXI8_9LACO|nr:C39 family peptidase [Lactobacillus psittaci]KRL61724.1 LytA [Lactobacillus psittaci DSM 15354]
MSVKKHTAILISALFAAGLIGFTGSTAKADTVQVEQAVTTQSNDQTKQNSSVGQANSSQLVSFTTTSSTDSQTIQNAVNSSNDSASATTNTVSSNVTATQTTSSNFVAERGVGRVNYVPGYGIMVWRNPGSGALNRYLKHGTSWQTFGYQMVNEHKWTNLGGDQWVDSNYLVDVNAKTATTANDGNEVVVAYTPRYSIAVWNEVGSNKLKFSGKFLPNGSAWRAFGKKSFNNSEFYNLGGNQWVDSGYVVATTATNSYKVLKNDANSREYYTSQYEPVWAPWGCASAALSMLMKYDGSFNNIPGSNEAAKLKYMQDHLPRNKAEGGQDGNPYTGAGFTRVILSKRLMEYAHQLGDNKVKDISGASLSSIASLVQGGHPVLYYGWSSYNGNGRGTDSYGRNHCKVILGYNPANNTFLVHDPLYRYKYFTKGGGGQREGIYNGYDLGPIAWVSASSINKEYAYAGGSNALTI